MRIRVVVCDQRTGKMALLYQSGKASKRHTKSPNAIYWQDFLPADNHSLYIWDSDSEVFGEEGQLKLAVAFYVVAVEGQDEDVSAKERLYRIAGGDTDRYHQHSSYRPMCRSTLEPRRGTAWGGSSSRGSRIRKGGWAVEEEFRVRVGAAGRV